MKKLICYCILLFLFIACESETQKSDIEGQEDNTEQLINEINMHDLEILTIDNCEYIFYKKSPGTNKGFGFMAHKGNYINPIHYYSRTKVK